MWIGHSIGLPAPIGTQHSHSHRHRHSHSHSHSTATSQPQPQPQPQLQSQPQPQPQSQPPPQSQPQHDQSMGAAREQHGHSIGLLAQPQPQPQPQHDQHTGTARAQHRITSTNQHLAITVTMLSTAPTGCEVLRGGVSREKMVKNDVEVAIVTVPWSQSWRLSPSPASSWCAPPPWACLNTHANRIAVTSDSKHQPPLNVQYA